MPLKGRGCARAGTASRGAGQYYPWLFFGAGPVESAIMDKYRKIAPDDEQQRMVGYGAFERTVAAFDAAVTRNQWLAGDAFSAADVYAGSQIDWPMQFGMLEPIPADRLCRAVAGTAGPRAGQSDRWLKGWWPCCPDRVELLP